jgi:oligosaccharide repeat unit polymerase
MRLDRNLISPAKLFILTWSFAIFAAYVGPSAEVYRRYDIINTTFTRSGIMWIIISSVAFLSGIATANRKLIKHISTSALFQNYGVDLDDQDVFSGIGIALVFTFLVCVVLLYWLVVTLDQLGGVSTFFGLIFPNDTSDWHSMIQIWSENKPFTGAKLLYSGLIASAIFSASGIGVLYKNYLFEHGSTKTSYLILSTLLSLSILVLILLQLVVSQRLLVATALVGALFTYIMITKRGISLAPTMIIVLIGGGVWTMQEIARVGFSKGGFISSIQYSANRFLFYFANDIGNLNRGIMIATEHSYGYLSFNFIFRYLFIESKALQLPQIKSFYSSIQPAWAGGTFTALGIPYLDFGTLGLIIIFIWGYISQAAYIHARVSLFAAQIYSLMAASIVLSWHFALWSNPLFWFNILLLIIFNRLIPALTQSRTRASSPTKPENK